MKQNLFKIFLFISLISTFTTYSDPLPIAVNDLEAKGIEKSEASIISDKLRNVLFNSPVFSVLERSQMEEILKEQGFQQTGCTDQSCAVEIGQLLGVKYIVAGSIGKLGKTYLLAIRLIDVATGKIVVSEDMDCKCNIEDVLNEITVEVANNVIKSAEKIKISENNASSAASFPLSINSTPQKAEVYINNEKKGLTPYQTLSMNEGNYNLKLQLKGYKTVNEKITIKGNPLSKEYTLTKTKKRLISKIGLGVLTVGSAVVGIVANNSAKNYISKSSTIKQDYINSASNDNFAKFQTDYNKAITDAERYSLIRNVSYGTCIAAAIGFTVNIAIK